MLWVLLIETIHGTFSEAYEMFCQRSPKSKAAVQRKGKGQPKGKGKGKGKQKGKPKAKPKAAPGPAGLAPGGGHPNISSLKIDSAHT